MNLPQELISLILSHAILLYTKPETIYWLEIRVFALDTPIQWENKEIVAGCVSYDEENTQRLTLCWDDRDRCVDYLLDVWKEVEDEENVRASRDAFRSTLLRWVECALFSLVMLLMFQDICDDLLKDRALAQWLRNVEQHPSLQTLFRVNSNFGDR